MVGSGLVSLPWTYQGSGIVLGIFISVLGVFVCYRTTVLILRVSGKDDEYFSSLYKYWGKPGYYAGLISTLAIIVAAVCAYFIIMS